MKCEVMLDNARSESWDAVAMLFVKPTFSVQIAILVLRLGHWLLKRADVAGTAYLDRFRANRHGDIQWYFGRRKWHSLQGGEPYVARSVKEPGPADASRDSRHGEGQGIVEG